ncbi:MAG TPA: hypothetical protein VG711_02130 [Phycisphaerales bacterium]|nr:hypothetical protein [Phycisphaerales bacterium]
MADPQDIVDIHGLRKPSAAPTNDAGAAKKFLMIWFKCCHTYGRLYRNKEQTKYEGRCPRCGAHVSAKIGEGGTNKRMFEAG